MAVETLGLTRMSRRSNLDIVWTVFKARILIISRYRGSLLLETLIPLVFAALPILIGVAVAGGDAAASENFEERVGTPDYRLYMLLGAVTFVVVSIMLWIVGFWIRREMEMGTLESMYLAPAKRLYLVSGIATYAFLRSLIAFAIALGIGSLVFQVNPFTGAIGLATVFLFVGLIPLWGLAFLFGAFILRVKEANSIVNSAQWVVSFFMGVFFPIAFFPPFLQWVALSFPPTWMNNGVRAALQDLSFFFGTWYFDLAILFVFAAIVPFLGYTLFLRTEHHMKKNEGVGQY